MYRTGTFIFFIICSIGCAETRNSAATFSPLITHQHIVPKNDNADSLTASYQIKYRSDGLEITGYLTRPHKEGVYPVIIYNRGGNRDYGTLTTRDLKYHQYLAPFGYVVLSSQLRGNAYSEGVDEFGGEDLNDILRLIEINKTLDFTNDYIGVYGISRGGLNAYQISRLSDEIKAIAVVGAPVDPRLDFYTRPEMYQNVFKEIVGDTIEHRAAYDYRSPIKWVDEINEPVLILHGTNDHRVKPLHADLMIQKLKSLNKEFKYKFVEHADHGLNSHKSLRDREILEWFDKYLKVSGDQ